jgi:hypothetical protein
LNETDVTTSQSLLGQKILIAGHFYEPVFAEAIRPLSTGVELHVRRTSGHPEETVLSELEFRAVLATWLIRSNS